MARRGDAAGAQVAAVGDADLDARVARAQALLLHHLERETRPRARRRAGRPHSAWRRCPRAATAAGSRCRRGDRRRRPRPRRAADGRTRATAGRCGPRSRRGPTRRARRGPRANALVVLDEGLLALDAEPLEQVPQLDDVRERAALVVGVVGEVAVERLVGLVEELVEARHRRIAGVLRHPGLDLPEDARGPLVHLRVGLVAERADEHAAERVEVEPREDLGMRGRELDDGARLRLAAAGTAGADLLATRRPRTGSCG